MSYLYLLFIKFLISQMTNRLHSHPCLITVAEMGAARHFLKTSLAGQYLAISRGAYCMINYKHFMATTNA